MTYEQIHNLFKQRYNQTNWKQFLGEAFAKSRLLATPEILTGIDSNVASQVQKLGYITLNENGIERQIAVYEVTLAQGIILERNRVGLRNLLRKYWKDIDAAFIAYHRPETPNWRFTYVSELTGYDAAGEFVKIKTEPKRYTYVLGEGESTRTAAERFTAIATKGSKATLEDVKEAFSVEKLSKAFFDEYKKHYDIFCDFMVSKPNIRQTIFNGDEKGIRDFNKKFLGRIVFLYFIQKKGWLGVPLKEDWGNGDFNFLTKQYENFRNKDLFYKDFLSILFFETLNTKRKEDIFNFDNAQFILKNTSLVKIPFLSGGLFDEDDKKQRGIIFPSNLIKSLFDFFNQYNFTIYEDSPNDHTVAVDPEMLGHIFENLLEDNKDKGAFYTPKEIVHYMCQESLIEYLCTALEIEDENKEKEAITLLLKKKELDPILKPEIKNLNKALDIVKICDPAIGSGAFPMGLLHEIFTAKQTLHTFEHGNTKTFDASAVKLNIIQNSIYGVDIEKGAVDIARLRFWLSLIVDEEKPQALPNLDYKIIVGNSLVSKLGDDIIDIDWTLNETSHGFFGADLAKQKGELLKKISKEQKEFFKPNSDKKKLAADIRNSKIDLLITQLELIVKTQGIETKPTGTNRALVKQTEIYLQTVSWKNSIKDLQKLKTKSDAPLQFFDWKLDFPEVMNESVTYKAGFDIVIANPPYIGQSGNRELFLQLLNTALGKAFHQRRMDYFYFFFHKAIELSKPNATISFITTNYYLNATYADKLRKDLYENCDFVRLINFNEAKIFESATGQHNAISILKKGKNESSLAQTAITTQKGIINGKIISDILYGNDFKTKYFEFKSFDIFELPKYHILIEGKGVENPDNVKGILLNSIKCSCKPLIEVADINQGIVSGANDLSVKYKKEYNIKRDEGDGIFVLQKDEIDALNLNKKEKQFIKPWYKNSDISRWVCNENTIQFLIYLTSNDDIYENEIPNLLDHFESFKPLLINRNVRTGRYSLEDYKNFIKGKTDIPYVMIKSSFKKGKYYLVSYARDKNVFESPKIVCPQRSPINTFGYTEEAWYGASDVYYIVEKPNSGINLKYLLAILNSKVLYFWLYNKGQRKGEILQLFKDPLSDIPIKITSPKTQKIFENNVNKIISKRQKKEDTIALEQEIDNLVYKLYELTFDEVKVIDPEFSLSKKEYEAIKLE